MSVLPEAANLLMRFCVRKIVLFRDNNRLRFPDSSFKGSPELAPVCQYIRMSAKAAGMRSFEYIAYYSAESHLFVNFSYGTISSDFSRYMLVRQEGSKKSVRDKGKDQYGNMLCKRN